MSIINIIRRVRCEFGLHDWKRAVRKSENVGMQVCRRCPEFRNVTLRKPAKRAQIELPLGGGPA